MQYTGKSQNLQSAKCKKILSALQNHLSFSVLMWFSDSSPPSLFRAQKKAAARKGSGLFSLRYRSGGTASWKLSQVYSAASTWPQVYPAASHSAQVR